jgi:hypothetical protein
MTTAAKLPPMTDCRRLCHGEGFDHDPTFMSIAKAGELLRCPICRREARIRPSAADDVDATRGVEAGEAGL